MAKEAKYSANPRMIGPGVPPYLRKLAAEVNEDVSFSASSYSSSSVSASSSSASSESSEST